MSSELSKALRNRKIFFINYVNMCMSVFEFVLINAEDINPLELEFQAIVCCPLWVLGTKRCPPKEKELESYFYT